MTSGTRAWVVAFLGAFPLAALAQANARTSSPPVARASFARVTYVTTQSVYVNAGTDDGVTEGTRLEVLRAGAVIAVLKPTYLSPKRTACTITSSTAAVVVGDSVRYTPGALPRVAETPDTTGADSEPNAAFSPLPSLHALGFRGRVGVRQLMVAQRDSGAASLSQPAADVRLDASSIAGSPVGLTLDVRGRRTTSSGIGGLTTPTTTATVYQALVSVNGHGEGARLAIGRQYADALGSVSLFDGATASWEQPRWTVGALGGMQPEPVQLGLSSAVHEYGVFASVRAAAGASTAWSFTSGAVGSYQGSEINREYLVEQATLRTHRASLYVVQEIDANRGWKQSLGIPMMSLTSTFASVRVDVIDELTVFAGVDGRRNVLLFRDRGTPESSFDDALRRGAWGGVDAAVSPHVRLGADARVSNDGGGSTAQAYTGTLSVYGLTPLALGGRVRSTVYSTDVSNGSMHVLSLSLGSIGPARLEGNGGLRVERSPGALGDSTTTRTSVHWLGLDADIGIGGSWYLLVSGTRQRGGWEGSDQLYTALTYRF